MLAFFILYSISFLFYNFFFINLSVLNFLSLFLLLEVFFLLIIINFGFISWIYNDILGEIASIFILGLVGVDSVIGFGLLYLYYRKFTLVNLSVKD